MANILLGYPNRLPAANLSGGSWRSSLPLDNLKDRRTLKLARSTNLLATSTTFDIDLTQARNIRVFALRRHNLTRDANFRLIGASSSTFADAEYDSGTIPVFGRVFDSLSLQWEDANFWTGQVAQEDVDQFVSIFLHVLPQLFQLRYWRVEITDTTNSDGYVDIGACFLSDTFVPEVNYDYGGSIRNRSRTNVAESQSGVDFFDVRDQKRETRFTLSNMSINEGYQRAFDLTRQLDVNGEILVSLDPEDDINLTRSSFVGRLTDPGALARSRFQTSSMTFNIQEVL